MRWRNRRQSTNIEDRRGRRPALRRGLPLGLGGIGLIVVLALVFGADPAQLLQLLDSSATTPQPGGSSDNSSADEAGRFVSVVLADTEQTWNAVFSEAGRHYQEPTLVLFSDAVQSACGYSSAAVGPFYCPADSKVYLDLSFFRELSQRLGAPGDFAAAYVVAHEIGHHVQNQLGISSRVRRAQQQVSREQANALSVRLELQADCLAGVWGHHAHRERQLIEPGDFEEGMGAAAAIGDDRLQRRSRGTVQPESWTHGSSAQRVEWLRRGLTAGDVAACDTFADSGL